MRIVIDFQGVQTESRFRGIGRYSLSLVQAIVRNRGEHEVILALSGLFPETIEPLRAAFDDALPQENIRVWYAPGPVREIEPDNSRRREAAELIREAFLASLKPDVLHICSLFEGYVDDAVISIGRFDTATLVSVSLYDLIPLLNPDHYLKSNLSYGEHYWRKIDHLKRAAIYLAISESSRQEGIAHLDVSEASVINISAASEPHFRPIEIAEQVAAQVHRKFGLTRPFLLYTGGADERKNIPRLLQAFARLPLHHRETYQLLLAGKISEGDLANLRRQAQAAGLKEDELCCTGYVTDEELVQLYNLCELFVFPSWHEGFGLPALEAMACGAPVICANTSSLPEVMGLDVALFDPLDVSSISAKIAEALEDESFRSMLREHCLRQAKQFSWDESARRAITAFESLVESRRQTTFNLPGSRKPRLAFVSPMPPERTGIADYSSELLPALAEYYDIEIVVAQNQVDSPWCDQRGKARDAEWLRAHASEIDRVLYQVGNSPFHQHMLPLMKEIPGTVVLHDFYMSGMLAWQETHTDLGEVWVEALYQAHGYGAVRERYQNAESAKLKYPVNLYVLQHALGLIVHSEYSRGLARRWYGRGVAGDWEVIPLVRCRADTIDRRHARDRLDIDQDDFVVCSFGFLDPTKLNHLLLDAWFGSALAADKRCKLIFVGENHRGDYGANLRQTIHASGIGDRIAITGFADTDTFRNYLAAADVAVQLRTNSRGETSAAVFDCMNHALPVIVNAHGSMAELDPESVYMLPDEFDDAALSESLESLWRSPVRRFTLGERAREIIQVRHAPALCAQRYAAAIERFHQRAATTTQALVEAIIAQEGTNLNDDECRQLAETISVALPLMKPARRLLLDVSATCRTDLRTGIERATRALLLALVDAPPEDYRIEPVYLSDISGEWKYHYARHYTFGLLGQVHDCFEDDIVEPECGDVLLGLDLSGDLLSQAARAGVFDHYRNIGVTVYFTVFDLLPVQMPTVFPPGANQSHSKWLDVVAESADGAICISKAVADDLAARLREVGAEWAKRRPFHIGWFHLGADVASSVPTRGLSDDAERTLQQFRSYPSFLMVGTIEPRKAHLQTINAFTQLWNEGAEINLVIVGKEGWKGLSNDMRRTIPETVEYIQNHPELGRRLFWLDGISDEYLEKVYAASTCLIAASYGEGFGLPLIEAAQHKLPIIARDIPVFREVAGEHAYYFEGEGAEELCATISNWLRLYREGHHPVSDDMAWLTWRESADQLAHVLLTPLGVAES